MNNDCLKTIIINNTYAGNYGFDKNNLPHEMINFFRADDLNFYVYITPYGVLKDKIKKDEIKGLLFVRSIGNGLVEVLAKAEVGNKSEFYTEGLQLFGKNKEKPEKSRSINSIYCEKGTKNKDRKEKLENSKNRLSTISEKVTYGNVSLSTIHKDNVKDNEIFVSLKVDKICLPKKTFYLGYKNSNECAISDDVYIINEGENDVGKKINNQSMLAYYYNDGETATSYKKLEDIMGNKELWKDETETPTFNSNNVSDYYSDFDNFFKVVRQQDNEVMFSNMFYYYFSEYPNILNDFVDKVLNNHLNVSEKITISKEHTIEREKERMDIRIIDDNFYIIIENKIKSGINGMHKEKDTKDFDKYDEKYISQLSVYYQKAEEKNQIDGKQRKLLPFIFVPDYSIVNKDYLKKFYLGEKYEIVFYSEIRDFFEKYTNNFSLKPNYIDDFVKALKKHTEKTDDEHRKILMFRLKNRIDKNK